MLFRNPALLGLAEVLPGSRASNQSGLVQQQFSLTDWWSWLQVSTISSALLVSILHHTGSLLGCKQQIPPQAPANRPQTLQGSVSLLCLFIVPSSLWGWDSGRSEFMCHLKGARRKFCFLRTCDQPQVLTHRSDSSLLETLRGKSPRHTPRFRPSSYISGHP